MNTAKLLALALVLLVSCDTDECLPIETVEQLEAGEQLETEPISHDAPAPVGDDCPQPCCDFCHGGSCYGCSAPGAAGCDGAYLACVGSCWSGVEDCQMTGSSNACCSG